MACADVNVFQFCKFLKVLGNVMILLVFALVGLSYYPVVIKAYGPQMLGMEGNMAAGIAVVILFHILAVLMLWSYMSCVLTEPGYVPADFRPDIDTEVPLPQEDKSDPRRPRFCRKCQRWKPERTHHCSVCGKCVLRMDHHCVWVVNCIGQNNYKFFFLFLLYTWLLCVLCCCALLPFFTGLLGTPDKAGKEPASLTFAFMAFIVDISFALSLLGFLIMHTRLIISNCTTIEMFEKERMKPWPYDRGWRRNLEEVFGARPLLWLLPVQDELGVGFCKSEEKQRLRI